MKIFLVCILIFLCGCQNKELVEPLDVPSRDLTIISSEIDVTSDIYLSDIVKVNNGFLTNDKKIDTFTLGKNHININYQVNNIKKIYNLEYKVVDKTPPFLNVSNISTTKGKKIDFFGKFICGDNYDKYVKCEIEGKYNFDEIGTYKLKAIATDSSNNKIEKEFTLNVLEKKGSTTKKNTYNIEDLIKKYKNNDTMIGIDVSSWQGNIDWNKVKKAGVEFAIIRIGYGHKDGKIIYDSKFKQNLENAKKAGIKVGLYFFSYAKTNNEALEQAEWIINSLKGEKLDLPIAFDWETWAGYNYYHLNFYELNTIAKTFLDKIKNSGYEAMLYGSAYYMKYIWNLDNYPTWLAYYTSDNNYKKKYYIWQSNRRGKVDGINTNVDLNILYKKQI